MATPAYFRMPFIPLMCILSLSCVEEARRNIPPPSVESIESDLEKTFQADQAHQDARYFTQFWRIAGTPSFDSCLNYVSERLARSGFSFPDSIPAAKKRWSITILSDLPQSKIWMPKHARLHLTKPEPRILLDFANVPLMLCSNSYSQNITAPLVYVRGGSKASDFEGRETKGKVVLCDDPPTQAWQHAVLRGALGILSAYVPPYNEPDRFPDIISEGIIPVSDSIRSFGLKVSPKIGRELKTMLHRSPAEVRIEIESAFLSAPVKTVVAEIPGLVRPKERVLFVAHLDHYKPGANDNASGAATLLEIASSVSRLIRSGAIPPPPRTLTFLWVDEYKGTAYWMKRHERELSAIQAVFVLDMVGGDPAKTGGLFRIEKMPDPGVVWFRSPDQHSGWGVGRWQEEKLFGSYLNDFMLSVVRGRSAKTGWKTTSNVWEGGSDHDPFVRMGIPAVLSWHFPDPFYHSSLDGMENISADQMKSAGVSIATAGLVLASGNNSTAERVLKIAAKAAAERLEALEASTIAEFAQVQRDPPETIVATRRQERAILEAWVRWYTQAFESVLGIPVEGPSSDLKGLVARESEQLQARKQTMILALDLE